MNKPDSKTLLSNLWHQYIKAHRLKLIIAVGFMMLEAFAMWKFVNSLKPLLDNVLTEQDTSKLLPITAVICGVFIVRGIGSFIHRSLTVNTGVHVVGAMQRDLTRHLLALDISFFNLNAPGGLIERVRGDTQALQSLASNTLLTLGRDSATLVAMAAAAVNVDWVWTLIVFVGAPLLVLPISLLQKAIRRYSRSARQASAILSTRLDEIFHGIKAIKLNNLHSHEETRFDDSVDSFVRSNLKSEYSNAAMPSIIDIIAGLGFVAVIYYGGQEIINGDKTVGDFMAFFTSVGFMFDPIRRLTNVSGAIQRALANLERIYELFEQQPRPRLSAKKQTLDQPTGDITFENVRFAYGSQTVIDDLSFIAPGGKTTALVGPSGAGKSTLFNLLTQLEVPDSGHIRIGNDELSDIDLNALRHEIAVVSQESALFDESIRDNVWLGDLNRSEQDIDEVCETALVNQFAADMPEGLNSLAGPRGTNLSGGQRQRVIIARALLRNAPILLLDEATSALDNQTETKIQALLDEFTKDKTTLVIAHRLTTVMNADLIHVMKQGRIVESGTHAELLAMNNHYAQLHKTLEN